jgi:hypothetical protein
MQANRRRKFKAPRLLKSKETARESDSDGDSIPFSELKEKVRAERQGVDCEEVPITTLLDSAKESAVENAEPVQGTTTKNSRNARMPKANMVGKKVSRDFGKKGIFHGEVIAVEYESSDEDKVEPIYVVEYTDGRHGGFRCRTITLWPRTF